MKGTVSTLSAAPALIKAASAEKSWASIWVDLFKLRLTTLVLLTTMAGFYLGSDRQVSWVLMLSTLMGTAFLASGASALNQWQERDYDARMRRTKDRPLPSGRLSPGAALIIGGLCAMAGMAYLALAVNILTAAIGALTLALYVFVYTPLKRVTTLNTVIGAIPGGLPPLMGWTAARGELSAGGWALFAILCFWQLPHFLAIAWMYRDDYARAGFVMLPAVDPDGERTGRQAISHTLGLLPVSLCPFVFHLSGAVYLAGAIVLGAGFLGCVTRFARERTMARARALFIASIIYLPTLLVLMVVDKV